MPWGLSLSLCWVSRFSAHPIDGLPLTIWTVR